MSHWVFWGGESRVGLKHEENQDAWKAFGNNLTEGVLVVICDGVSSTEYGKEAAQIVVQRLTEACERGELFRAIHGKKSLFHSPSVSNGLAGGLTKESSEKQSSSQSPESVLISASDLQTEEEVISAFFARSENLSDGVGIGYLRSLVVDISQELRDDFGRAKAACTMAMLWLFKREAYLLCVGDSPIFLLRKNSCFRLTEQRKDGGRLRAFIGMGREIDQHLHQRRLELKGGDCFVLATDGVAEYVSTKDIFKRWQNSYRDPNVVACELVDLAEAMGSDDDNTAIAVRIPYLVDPDFSRQKMLEQLSKEDKKAQQEAQQSLVIAQEAKEEQEREREAREKLKRRIEEKIERDVRHSSNRTLIDFGDDE
ncbi:MAG: hypothetical protein CMK59_09250 [Proteobacteria bacterium]|nr:hypothetical protein [Pseudomonadota bacterium]